MRSVVHLDFADVIDQQGLEVVRERYGNLFDMYQRITGEDAYQAPMRIYPAPHDTMGGLAILNREYLRAGVVESGLPAEPESPHAESTSRTGQRHGLLSFRFVTKRDPEHQPPTSPYCKMLMEADLRRMAIILTVGERPL